MTGPFITVVTGTVVFVVGQLIARFVIEPISELHKLRGQIADSLIFYANACPPMREEIPEEAHRIYREQSGLLMAKKHMIPFYNLWARCRLIPSRVELFQAHQSLIGLSNSVFDAGINSGENRDRCRLLIKVALHLDLDREVGS